ncbi:MAG: hypothetical protein HGA24_00065 [Candidatus Aminicenantes bacterium]|nr:hypothetical protein [Candidatus Aminicenantes bacterium]
MKGNWARVLVLGLLAVFFAACSAGGDPPPPISVTLTAGSANVHVNRSMQFSASVHNSTNTAVTWNLSGSGCSGATCGMISNGGLYTAPGSVPSPATVTVKATSVADTSKSASATITILAAVVVTVSPPDSLVAAGGTRQFTASVQNVVDNSVTWAVSGSGCTGSECGTISDTGLYTAPAVVPAAPAVLITATSGEDTATSGSATATIVEPISLEWTWISGSDTIIQPGTYGTKGVPSPSNVPGAREGPVSWLDSQGNLWLFGGYVYDLTYTGYFYNDLWKFDPATQNWTWVSGSDTRDHAGIYGTKGIADPSNVPGSRNFAVSWIDSQGNLWLFGGSGLDSTGEVWYLNDLWKFDPATLEWTWVSGSDLAIQPGVYGTKGIASPSNVPGARDGAVSWLDSQGNLWLFGGFGVASANDWGVLNDLWRFDPVTVEWTWVSGSDSSNQPGVYGTKGEADPSNCPTARGHAISWTDSHGKLWLFGGIRGDVPGSLNDLWKFDLSTLEWTWVSGSNTVNQAGTYVTKGVPDPLNVPGARMGAVSWIDPSGKLYLFGGYSEASATDWGVLNDLWRFDPVTVEWTWVSGSNAVNQPGVYGTKGIADASNVPGGRLWAVSWIDLEGRLWLFGGQGTDSVVSSSGSLNDLWRGNR